MPISDRNLGKYKVPGIYIEESDQSIRELPIQEVLINLVPGFSKKGPFNKPVRVDNVSDFEDIFGALDKNLENKGSYFHRTVNTMLSQGPVWALNLLNTDPTRDKLQWKSISLSSQYDNGRLISSPYERFFNRQDFWERDDESFNDIVIENNGGQDDDDRLLHITNMSNRKITTFIFKSRATGFDVTAESWYGGKEKVPLFMNHKDYISDYMVGILIVNGDWTNYSILSSDNVWGKYFNEKGLIKDKIEEFSNDRLVTTLDYYDASLIPNFRDLDNRDMYIKNLINNNTNKTGLFCTFNESELLESDFYKGKIDLLGQTLVGLDTDSTKMGTQPKDTIDFISYNTKISESLTFNEKDLDSSGNVFGNYSSDMETNWLSGRTASHTDWYTHNISFDDNISVYTELISSDQTNLTLDSITNLSEDDIIYFNKSFSIIDRSKPYYIKTVSGTDITISLEKGGSTLTGINIGTTSDIYVYKLTTVFNNSYYNLNGYQYNLNETISYLSPFTINNESDTYSRYDVMYLSNDNTKINSITGTQKIGTNASLPNYILDNENTIILGYAKTIFSGGTWSQDYTGVTVDSTGYIYLDSDYISVDSGTTDNNNYMDIIFENTYGSSSDWTNYKKLRSLKIYNKISSEIILGKSVMINKTNGYKYPIVNPNTVDATLSSNARIRIFLNNESPYDYIDESNSSFIIYYLDDEFKMGNGTISNIKTTYEPLVSLVEEGIVAKYSSLYNSYYNGNINNGDYIYMDNNTGSTQQYWLKMYLDSDDNLKVKFYSDDTMSTPANIEQFETNYDSKLIVYSNKSNWKQTIEIENIEDINDLTSNTSIYVDKERYSEITRGSFLEAYYDTSYYDSPGEGYMNGEIPKKFVRIVDVKNDSNDTNLKILYTDGPIKINQVDDEYYTTSYHSIDNYITEYKGISIEPFIVHTESIPNGTETRQNNILDVIGNGTRLAKGLSNKNRISWRYLVDSFGLGLTANSKQQYLDLCGNKLNSLGFINMPSAKTFKKSINPSFLNDDYSISMDYIKEGANPDKNPDFYYSFGEGIGQSCVSYWFPYIKTDEESTKFIPPASEMAKTFMNKFTTVNETIRPWSILGGVIKGRLTNVRETEIRFNRDDLKPLHEMGTNPIEYVENYGYIINSDNTAQVYPYSSLSLIHSREVLIELENRLYDMLLNYHWRFNTPEIRAEIKFRADQICKELSEGDALYNFRNVCDKTNNTDYIIDLQMGVLDTYVEIVKGMGIIINQITILKKGDLESTGFLPQ